MLSNLLGLSSKIFVIAFGLSFAVGNNGYISIDELQAAPKKVPLKGTCKNPPGSYKKSGGTMTFTLKHRTIGGCSVDKKPRHSAPYWERSEIRSSDFKKGINYKFTFDIKFDPSTESAYRTTFFQIHTYSKRTCPKCYPALKLNTNSGGRLTAELLQNGGRQHFPESLNLNRAKIAGDWIRFEILMGSDDGMNDIRIFANGTEVLASAVYIPPEGSLFVRAGLYRPGNKGGLPTDRVSIRDLRYEKL